MCDICNDKGMTGWHKPMRGIDGMIRMIFLPQICQCEAGIAAAKRYEQNLRDGKAGLRPCVGSDLMPIGNKLR